ncbi:MAG TPA: MFS transporter [Pirellulaceae bacterium]|nr:MFS transporter [Pirellulaceae bacterium]
MAVSDATDGENYPPPPQAATTGSLLVIFLTVMIDLLGFGLVLPLLPLYARQYSTDEHGLTIGLLMASFSAMQFLGSPIWGRLSDRIGRRPVLLIGLFGSAVFYSLFAIATTAGLMSAQTSLLLIFASRIGAGLAGATISTAQAYIADTTGERERSKGMALIGFGFGIGFTLGPLIGLLAVGLGNGDPGPWPGWIAAGLSATAFLLAIFLLPESLSAGNRESATHDKRIRDGLKLLRLPILTALYLASFICVFSFANFETTLALLLQGDEPGREAIPAVAGLQEHSPFALSWTWICITFAYIGVTLAFVQGGLVRRLATRLTDWSMCRIGIALNLIGLSILGGAVAVASLALLYVGLSFTVAGFAFLQPSLNGWISRSAPSDRQGVALGFGQSISALARIFGSGLGIPLLMLHVYAPYALAFVLFLAGAGLLWRASRMPKPIVA